MERPGNNSGSVTLLQVDSPSLDVRSYPGPPPILRQSEDGGQRQSLESRYILLCAPVPVVTPGALRQDRARPWHVLTREVQIGRSEGGLRLYFLGKGTEAKGRKAIGLNTPG